MCTQTHIVDIINILITMVIYMAKLTLNYDSLYHDDDKTVELFNWTNVNVGRLKKLSLFIFNNVSMLYLYKSGKLKISDELYAKIKTGMAEIEKLESHTKKSYVSKISFSLIYCFSCFLVLLLLIFHTLFVCHQGYMIQFVHCSYFHYITYGLKSQ